MEQEIVIRKKDFTVETEEKHEANIEFNYLRTRHSEFEKHSEFLHLQVNGHRGLSVYLELDKWQIKDLIKVLEEKVNSI